MLLRAMLLRAIAVLTGILSSGCSGSPEPASALDRALNAHWTGRPELSGVLADRFLAMTPGNCDALALKLHLPEKNLSARLAVHERYRSHCGQAEDEPYARLLVLAGNWDKACAIATPPKDGEMAVLNIEACVDTAPQARLDGATVFLERFPESAALLSVRAHALADLGQFSEAAEMSIEAMRMGDFSDSHLFRTRGLLLRVPNHHWLTPSSLDVLLTPPTKADQVRKIRTFQALTTRLASEGFQLPWRWRIQTANRATALLDAKHCASSAECASWLDLLAPGDWSAILRRALTLNDDPAVIIRKIHDQTLAEATQSHISLAETGIELLPRAAIFHVLKAGALASTRPAEARDYYLHAIDLAPWEISWRLRATELLKRMGQEAKAERLPVWDEEFQ